MRIILSMQAITEEMEELRERFRQESIKFKSQSNYNNSRVSFPCDNCSNDATKENVRKLFKSKFSKCYS